MQRYHLAGAAFHRHAHPLGLLHTVGKIPEGQKSHGVADAVKVVGVGHRRGKNLHQPVLVDGAGLLQPGQHRLAVGCQHGGILHLGQVVFLPAQVEGGVVLAARLIAGNAGDLGLAALLQRPHQVQVVPLHRAGLVGIAGGLRPGKAQLVTDGKQRRRGTHGQHHRRGTQHHQKNAAVPCKDPAQFFQGARQRQGAGRFGRFSVVFHAVSSPAAVGCSSTVTTVPLPSLLRICSLLPWASAIR